MADNQVLIDMFFRLLDNGVAVFVVTLLLWALWKEGAWIAEEILKPARNRVFEHLDNTNEALKGLCDTMDALKDEIGSKHVQVGEKLNNIHVDVKSIKSHLNIPGE